MTRARTVSDEVGGLLAAASKLSSTAEVVRAKACGVVAAVSKAALERWDSADSLVKDLAAPEVNVDAALHGGVDPADAIADACALALRVLYKIDLEAALATPQAHTPIDRLAGRVRWTARFAAHHAMDFRPEDRQVATDLQAASWLANQTVFDTGCLPELVSAMAELFDWALSRGTTLLGFELAE